MNYLAHLHLADDSDFSRIGNLQGDFMRGVDLESLLPEIRQGVLMHRWVDAFTDRHPVVKRSRQRLAPEFRRYAGVMVDVFYDHFLARHWQRYRPRQSLSLFTQGVYHGLHQHRHLLAGRLREVAPAMAAGDWLSAYGLQEGIQDALCGLSRRLRRANPLALGGSQLALHARGLEEDFAAFFPVLEAAAADFKQGGRAPA